MLFRIVLIASMVANVATGAADDLVDYFSFLKRVVAFEFSNSELYGVESGVPPHRTPLPVLPPT